MIAPKKIDSVVLFGGGGLVGYQIARLMSSEIKPKKIVICTLFESEAAEAVEKLSEEFPSVEFIPQSGNLFVREDFANTSRGDISDNSKTLSTIYDDVFGNLNEDCDNVGTCGLMPQIIMKHKPDVVVDCVNTATAISYQDVKSSSKVVKEFRDNLGNILDSNDVTSTITKAKGGDQNSINDLCRFAENILDLANSPLESFPNLTNLRMMDLLLISQAVPQLVRHVTLLYNSLLKAETSVYVKVGTTGTGGMGVNIPFTHGEDRPSFTLMAKTSVGFAHTGLLFLLARSPGPIIKEIKPGAMIGYKKVTHKKISKFRNQVNLTESKRETLGSTITVRQRESDYTKKGELSLVGIDTGENGFFSRGEYEAITYLDSMEFVTPEEIAKNVLYEICGDNTGKDIIAAIDGSVMDPSYRAGYIRQAAVDEMLELEEKQGMPSIAIGELGPPQLSKLLYEVHLLQSVYPKLEDWASDSNSADEMSKKVTKYLDDSETLNVLTSLGLAVMRPDGKNIDRGPTMYIPESKVHATVDIEQGNPDTWAKQGWIDLRPENFSIWKERAKKMLASRELKFDEGSAAFNPGHYTSKTIKTGEVVGWILSTEFEGSRQK